MRVWAQNHYNGIIMMMQILWRKCRFSHEDESSEAFPQKIISLAVAVRLVWSHNPKSYTSQSFSYCQVLPSQADQRVGSRQIDDWITDSRVRVVLTGRYNLCYLAESYCCSGENAAIIGRCCFHLLSNQQPKEISEEIRPVSEWVSDTVPFLNYLNG